MDWISTLEKRFGSWAIPNLAIYLVGIQLIGVVLLLGQHVTYTELMLNGNAVMQEGEYWRLLSFMMLPKSLHPIWLIFAYLIFYFIGRQLETHWGTFRFNLFILTGYLLTVVTAFIVPTAIITNIFFLGCVFLAFATLYPDVEFRLYFILPVKVKWLGWLTVAAYVLVLFSGDIGSRLGVAAAFINYALFFGHDFVRNLRAGARRRNFQSTRMHVEAQTLHRCAECGVTDKADGSVHFRYCSTCGKCFCEQHIVNHRH